MKCIFGIDSFEKGEILVEGRPVKISAPDIAMKLGIGLVPESRKLEALFPVKSVMFNITIKAIQEFIKGIFVNAHKETAITDEYVRSMGIRTPAYEQPVGNLSG